MPLLTSTRTAVPGMPPCSFPNTLRSIRIVGMSGLSQGRGGGGGGWWSAKRKERSASKGICCFRLLSFPATALAACQLASKPLTHVYTASTVKFPADACSFSLTQQRIRFPSVHCFQDACREGDGVPGQAAAFQFEKWQGRQAYFLHSVACGHCFPGPLAYYHHNTNSPPAPWVKDPNLGG